MRKRCYIAGPISRGDLCDKINQGTEAFIALAKAGFSPFCPMWSCYSKPARRFFATAFEPDPECADGWVEKTTVSVACDATAMGNEDMTHADWLGVDLPWVEASDALLRLPGESTGADMEVHHARAHGVPVFHSIEDLVAYFEANAKAGAA